MLQVLREELEAKDKEAIERMREIEDLKAQLKIENPEHLPRPAPTSFTEFKISVIE